MLYKISNLQYSIRMKEVEYNKAMNANDQFNMDVNKAALALLKEDLAATVKEFNSIPAPGSNNTPKGPKKGGWWQSFFNLKAATNRK